MVYTATQLNAAWDAANDGAPRDAATTTLLAAFAAQTSTGQLTDNQALAYVINSADKTTAVAVEAYQFFTGKTPTKAGLDFLVNSTANATDLNDPYYTAFNIENRYMNFAANLGIVGEGATAFNTTYGTAAIPLFSTFIGTIYETIIGSSYAVAAGINVTAALNDVIGRQAAFTQIARERGIITSTSTQAQIDIATRAVAVGYLLVEGIKADIGIYAAGSNNFVNALINGTAVYNTSLIATYSPLGGGVGSPIASGGVAPGIPGSTLAFTSGIDAVTGTANDDTFNGAAVQNPTTALLTTFSAFDSANGAAGNDTLNIIVTDAGVATFGAGGITLPAAAITGIETINIRAVDQSAAASTGVTAVATNFAGATAFNNDRSTNTAAGSASAPTLTLTGLASGQAVGVVGLGGATAVGGVAATYSAPSSTTSSTFSTTINLTGGTGSGVATTNPVITIATSTGAVTSSTINSNGTVANVVGNLTLDDAGANAIRLLSIKADAALTTGTLSGLGGQTVGATAGSTSATIAITGNGSITTGAIDGGTAATINALAITTGPGTFTAASIGAAGNTFLANSTVTISGGSTTTAANAASVNIGALAGNVTTLNGSGLTAGGVGFTTPAAASALAFTGGGGTDIVTIAGGFGATFTGTLNAAGGTGDIIAFTTGADLVSGLTPLVTNFEILRVSNASGAAQIFDPTLINGITSYQVGTITGAGSLTTVTNLVANANVTIFGNNATAANTLSLLLKDASGTADVVNVRLDNLSTATTGAAGVNGGVLLFGGSATGVAGQVETLNIISAGKQSATGAYNLVTLGGSTVAAPGPNYTDPTTVNVSGSVGVTVTTATTAVNHAQTINASTQTFGVAIVNTTATVGPFTLIGSGANDTISSANVASIFGGAGGDSFVLGAGAQTLVYTATGQSVLDLAGSIVGSGFGNAQTGVATAGTTKTTGTMDIVTTFGTTIDKIDVSTFGFGAGGLGGGIADKGTANTDAAFNLLLTTGTGVTGVFGTGIVQRGLAVIHVGAGTSGGEVADILLIDVNKDGAFTAATDLAVKFVGAPGLVITDFVI